MQRPLFLAVILVGLLLRFTPAAHADDLKSMEGKWKVESAEFGGKAGTAAEVPDLQEIHVTITGATYEVVSKDKIDRGSLTLDESQKPKSMDVTRTEGKEAGTIIKAIYELSADTLRVCYSTKESERPKEFATKPDSQLLLITYRREK